MKLNDIYRWHYSAERLKKLRDGNNGGTTYWCQSQIAICQKWHDGRLVLADTYWHRPESYLKEDSIKNGKVIIEYIGNLDELERTNEDCYNYYKREDIIDIRCSNNGNYGVYIKKGAKRDLEVTREYIKYELEKKEYKAKSAADDVIRYKKVLEELTEDNLDKVWI